MNESRLCFYAGLISIPTSIALWFFSPELGASSANLSVVDLPLREALQAAHAERWGIFVGLWAPTLLILSGLLKK